VRPKDLGLRSDSFTLDGAGSKRRVIANVEALSKVGKTDFCLRYTPDPIVVFNFDQGLEGVIEKHRARGKRIIIAGVPKSNIRAGYPSYHFAKPVPKSGEMRSSSGRLDYMARVQAQAMPIWERFMSDLREFYESDARTGVIDTGKAAYALGKFAYIGMDTGKRPKDDPFGQKSGNLNALFQGLITDGYNYDKNVLWIHRLKEKWIDNKPSGKYITSGYGEINYEVELTIRLKRNRKGKRVVEVRDCRLDEAMNGEEFEGDDLVRFPAIMALVTGTDEEAWEK